MSLSLHCASVKQKVALHHYVNHLIKAVVVSVLFYNVAWMVSLFQTCQHFDAPSDKDSERSTCELSTLVFLTVNTLHIHRRNKTRNKKPFPVGDPVVTHSQDSQDVMKT